MSDSIEARAVAALAAIQKIGDNVTNEHPMRHQVRGLKREAYAVLSEAFRIAHTLAYTAEGIIYDYDKAQSVPATHKEQT